ncbi:MAG: hypothetical protein WD355_00885 [Balneolaceae bacterium]
MKREFFALYYPWGNRLTMQQQSFMGEIGSVLNLMEKVAWEE